MATRQADPRRAEAAPKVSGHLCESGRRCSTASGWSSSVVGFKGLKTLDDQRFALLNTASCLRRDDDLFVALP
jgi:hypothetical protein